VAQQRGAPKNKKIIADYRTKFRSEESIAAEALKWRKTSGEHNFPRFDIVNFYNRHVIGKSFGAKGTPIFETIAEEAKGRPAYVRFRPLILRIKESILESASLGHHQARFIMAHELGHIVLHDHDAKEFSAAENRRSIVDMNNLSTEWQADTFARYFLMPLHVVKSFHSADELAVATQSPLKWANKQFNIANEPDTARKAEIIARVLKGYTGDVCSSCGNFTLLPNGPSLKCDTCGVTTKIFTEAEV
jgi:Zn-dependent peptidase ImmA (M78 family)